MLLRACLLPLREKAAEGRMRGFYRESRRSQSDRNTPHPLLRGTFSRKGRRKFGSGSFWNSNATSVSALVALNPSPGENVSGKRRAPRGLDALEALGAKIVTDRRKFCVMFFLEYFIKGAWFPLLGAAT
jgi:hypothetical protein